MAKFLQIALHNIDGEAAEVVSEAFNRYGYGGAVMEAVPPDFSRVTVRTLIPLENRAQLTELEVVLALMSKALPQGLPEVQIEEVDEQDWAEGWKEHFHVIRIGPRVVIQPSWREYEAQAQDVVVQLDPGLAFGTGLHPTTQLCLLALQQMDLQQVEMFDVGTGSGILSIAAAGLGAGPIRAVDVDPVAVRVADENVARNGCQNEVTLAVGSAAAHGGRQWSLVMANILAHILIDIMADLKAALTLDGRLVLSGIIEEQAASMQAALDQHNLQVLETLRQDDWLALIVGHSEP